MGKGWVGNMVRVAVGSESLGVRAGDRSRAKERKSRDRGDGTLAMPRASRGMTRKQQRKLSATGTGCFRTWERFRGPFGFHWGFFRAHPSPTTSRPCPPPRVVTDSFGGQGSLINYAWAPPTHRGPEWGSFETPPPTHPRAGLPPRTSSTPPPQPLPPL